ncbi:MAG: hypothetical protein M1820_000345 [Bogoriella megaspora]|nr:MAG: hypothetical protein M1820_000345 [Bogoriella megaspora]
MSKSSSNSPPGGGGVGGFSRKSLLWNPKLREGGESSLTVVPVIGTTPPNASHDRKSSHSSTRSKRRESSLHSLTHSVTDFSTSVRRSISLRSPTDSLPSETRDSPLGNPPTSISPKKRSASAAGHYKSTLPVPAFARKKKSYEGSDQEGTGSRVKGILAAPFGPKPKTSEMVNQSGNAYASTFTHTQTGSTLGGPMSMSTSNSGAQNPNLVYQHIHDMASKRISTLDYLRKAHEGRIYWFNTLHFTKSDLSRLSYFDPRKLSRRATNYLLLGYSLPTILDLNSQTPTEYLRALNALLAEFEAYQTLHPPDASTSSSLSRARIPQIFKRTTGASSKARRTSSAAQSFATSDTATTPVEPPSTTDAWPDPNALTNVTSNSSNTYTSPTESLPPATLLPNESYTHLLTPSLPFEPDFFETFATLCDVLIDTYSKIMSLLERPEHVAGSPGIGELFAKADARVRKVLVAGVVREFEEASRVGAKGELGGVGKVVLGGLM